ncbi:glycoside hydrolase family 76 protein [Haloferula sp. BvORR071]|uniref:glycoside hydrolase family 76 protein n=1 Tax=Haloferula sp. BvORR071 TaxID=1396141 RepID=UPI00069804BB|nr:glycoside hydrolase family 76 protein [Haloferula sp. BvORR071]
MIFQTLPARQITRTLLVVAQLCALSAGIAQEAPPAPAPAPEQPAKPAVTPAFRDWAVETMEVLHKDLWIPETKLYAEKADVTTGTPDHPSFMWGVGVQLSAMAAAAKAEPDKYLEPLKNYADAIQVYWLKHDGIEGFDVQPGPKASDRYYDDNAWLVLALAEVFEVTKDQKYLDRSVATFRFVMSGEDDKLGGGLYWRELEKTSKNTCTNAPAIASGLRLYQLTKDEKHLEAAKRLYAWTCKTMQDGDGLFWDNIKLDGQIDRRKFTYNSALMIRSNCLLNEITGEAKYLDEAKRIATAAEKQWIQASGAIADSGRFAHLLLESFLELHERDKDPHWTETVSRCLVNLHSEMRDENGRYPHQWARWGRRGGDRRPAGPIREAVLLNQASPARIYWLAAAEIPKPKEEAAPAK